MNNAGGWPIADVDSAVLVEEPPRPLGISPVEVRLPTTLADDATPGALGGRLCIPLAVKALASIANPTLFKVGIGGVPRRSGEIVFS